MNEQGSLRDLRLTRVAVTWLGSSLPLVYHGQREPRCFVGSKTTECLHNLENVERGLNKLDQGCCPCVWDVQALPFEGAEIRLRTTRSARASNQHSSQEHTKISLRRRIKIRTIYNQGSYLPPKALCQGHRLSGSNQP